MVKEVPHVNVDNVMQVMCEDRHPMSLDNMGEGCRVFVRLGSCRMEVVGRLVEEWRVAEKKVNKLEFQESWNIFVVLKYWIYCLGIMLEFLCPSFSSLKGSFFWVTTKIFGSQYPFWSIQRKWRFIKSKIHYLKETKTWIISFFLSLKHLQPAKASVRPGRSCQPGFFTRPRSVIQTFWPFWVYKRSVFV